MFSQNFRVTTLLVLEANLLFFFFLCNFLGTVCPPFHKRLSIWRSLEALDEVAWFFDQKGFLRADI